MTKKKSTTAEALEIILQNEDVEENEDNSAPESCYSEAEKTSK